MDLYESVLSAHAFSTLQKIMTNKLFKNFYLAGGTALALQLGHRKSEDLDLFSAKEFKSNIVVKLKDYKVISLGDNSIEIAIGKTKLFFFYFAFPLFKDIIHVEKLRMADPVDIGLMKLLALQGRTCKKDIMDLFFIDKNVIPLQELLEIFEQHFPKESFNSYSSIKTLLDPNQLSKTPTPKMIEAVSWQDAYNLVQAKVMKHIRELIS